MYNGVGEPQSSPPDTMNIPPTVSASKHPWTVFTTNWHTGILLWMCHQGLPNTREELIIVIFSPPCLVRDVVSQSLSILFLFNGWR